MDKEVTVSHRNTRTWSLPPYQRHQNSLALRPTFAIKRTRRKGNCNSEPRPRETSRSSVYSLGAHVPEPTIRESPLDYCRGRGHVTDETCQLPLLMGTGLPSPHQTHTASRRSLVLLLDSPKTPKSRPDKLLPATTVSTMRTALRLV